MRYLLSLLILSSVTLAEEPLALKLEKVVIKPLETVEIEEAPEKVTLGIQVVWEL